MNNKNMNSKKNYRIYKKKSLFNAILINMGQYNSNLGNHSKIGFFGGLPSDRRTITGMIRTLFNYKICPRLLISAHLAFMSDFLAGIKAMQLPIAQE